MNEYLISVYWNDVLFLIDYIISWGFKLCLIILLYQVVEYLNWKD